MVLKYVSMWEGACHIYDTKQFSNISRASNNSPLMLSAQGQCQIPRVKGSVLQDCPPPPLQMPLASPRQCSGLLTYQLQTRGSHNLPLRFE